MGEKEEEEEKSIIDVIDYESVFLSYSSRWQRIQYKAKHLVSKLKSIIL